MERTARLFRNGRNQAVRLPVEFEFDAEQVYVRKEKNGDIVLSTRPSKKTSWDNLFIALEKLEDCDDFLTPETRNQGAHNRDPFEGADL